MFDVSQATEREHYGTVTGAMLAGCREGLRVSHLLNTSWKSLKPPENLYYTSWTGTADDLAQGGGKDKTKILTSPTFFEYCN